MREKNKKTNYDLLAIARETRYAVGGIPNEKVLLLP